MTEKYSERDIKDTLENLQAPYNVAHWNIFEQKLNAPFTDDNPASVEAVDKVMHPKLTRLEPAFNVAHWELMAARLRQIAARRRQVISTKLLETAIVLLLILNLPGWLGMIAPTNSTFNIPRNQALAEWNEPTKDAHISEKNDLKSNSFSPNSDNNSTFKQRRNVISDMEPGSKVIENTPTPVSIGREIFDAFRNFILEKMPDETPPKPNPAVAANDPQLIDNQLITAENISKINDFSMLSSREISELNTAKSAIFLPLVANFKSHSPRQIQIGVFTGLDYNFVKTPADQTSAKSIEQVVAGYTAGILFSGTKGRIGCEAGLTYSAKTLNRNETDIYGSFKNGYVKQLLEKQAFQIVGVPVRATIKIGRARHVTISARAGLTANVVMQKNSVRKSFPTTNAAMLDSNEVLPLARKISEEHRGYFEGGNFYNNSFLTADFAIRFDRPIGGKMRFFVQPTVQKTINPGGLSVRSDRLTTFSLQAGLTTTL